MLSDIKINNTKYGTSVSYERDEEFCGGILRDDSEWQKTLNEKFEKLSDNKDSKALSKDDFFQIYAENDSDYISKELSKYLDSLQDLNGNKIDFNSLNTKQQYNIINFLQQSLERPDIYGTHANLSDIKIDINQESLYIEANIHTIDGNVLSSAAEFIPSNQVDDTKYYGDKFEDFERDYKISFSDSGILSTDERKNLLNEIYSKELTDLDEFMKNFKGNIEISFTSSSTQDNNYSALTIYEKSNLELDIDQAMQNVKNLPKEKNNEDKENQKFTLLNLYWDNFKKDLENFDELYKNKQENPLFKNSISPLKDILKSNL